MAIFRKELREMLGEESWEDEQARWARAREKREKRAELRRKLNKIWDRFWEILPIIYVCLVVYLSISTAYSIKKWLEAHPTDIHIHIGGDK